jgi:hypothetical protein
MRDFHSFLSPTNAVAALPSEYPFLLLLLNLVKTWLAEYNLVQLEKIVAGSHELRAWVLRVFR